MEFDRTYPEKGRRQRQTEVGRPKTTWPKAVEKDKRGLDHGLKPNRVSRRRPLQVMDGPLVLSLLIPTTLLYRLVWWALRRWLISCSRNYKRDSSTHLQKTIQTNVNPLTSLPAQTQSVARNETTAHGIVCLDRQLGANRRMHGRISE